MDKDQRARGSNPGRVPRDPRGEPPRSLEMAGAPRRSRNPLDFAAVWAVGGAGLLILAAWLGWEFLLRRHPAVLLWPLFLFTCCCSAWMGFKIGRTEEPRAAPASAGPATWQHATLQYDREANRLLIELSD